MAVACVWPVLALSACKGNPESGPDSPISDTWQITGQLESSFEKPKKQLFRLTDRDTGQPITAECKLWPFSTEWLAFASSYLGDEQYRKGTARSDGVIEVEQRSQHSDLVVGYRIEVPQPAGYQMDFLPEKIFENLDIENGNTIELHYLKRRHFTLRTGILSGPQMHYYAMPIKPCPAMRLWSAGRQNGHYEPVDYDYTHDSVSRIAQYYVSNPFHRPAGVVSHIKDFRFTASWGTPFANVHQGITDDKGCALIDNLYDGEWEIVVFNNGSDLTRSRVTIGSDTDSHVIEAPQSQEGWVNIECTCMNPPEDIRGRRTILGLKDLKDLKADPRYGNQVWSPEDYPLKFVNGKLSIKLRFSHESSWELSVNGNYMYFDSVIGQTNNHLMVLEDDWQSANWTVNLKLGDELLNGYQIDTYANLWSIDFITSGKPVEVPAGHRSLFLPGNIRHDIILRPGEERIDTFDVPYGTIKLEVVKFIYEQTRPAWRSLICVTDTGVDLPDVFVNGRATLEIRVPVGVREWKFAEFEGNLRLTEGETVHIELTKEHCTGYSKIMIEDLAQDLEWWVDIIGATKVAYIEDGPQWHCYAPAGKYFLYASDSYIPIEIPSQVKVTKSLIDKYKSNYADGLALFGRGPTFPEIFIQLSRVDGRPVDECCGYQDIPFGEYFYYSSGYSPDSGVNMYSYSTVSISGDGIKHIDGGSRKPTLRPITLVLSGGGDDLNGQLSWWGNDHDYTVTNSEFGLDFEVDAIQKRWFDKTVTLDFELPEGSYTFVPWFDAPNDKIVHFEVGDGLPTKIVIRD